MEKGANDSLMILRTENHERVKVLCKVEAKGERERGLRGGPRSMGEECENGGALCALVCVFLCG